MSKLITTYAEYELKMKEFERRVSYMGKAQRGYNVLIVSGSPGIGKTHNAKEVLERESEIKWDVATASISPVELYKKLWQMNNACLVLDDVNNILKDAKDGASLLKAATDTYKERVLTWYKSNAKCIPVSKSLNVDFTNMNVRSAMDDYVNALCANKKDSTTIWKRYEDGEYFPNKYKFTGSLIILTNKRLGEFDRVTEGAVSNRGAHMEMAVTRTVALEIINKKGPAITDFNGEPLKEEVKADVIKYINSVEATRYLNVNDKTLSLRTFGKMVSDVQNGISELDCSLLESVAERPYA